MYKRIPLLIFSVFSLNIYSQVVIKDEIKLDELIHNKDRIESAELPMPFFGKVFSQIPCQSNHWTSGAIKIKRMAGGQTKLDGCWPPFVCGYGSCFCTWGTRAHTFHNVLQGEVVSIEIQRCFDPPPDPPYEPDWYDVPIYFSFVANNKYDIYGQDLSDNSWDYIGFILLTEEEPPACITQFCEYEDSNYGLRFEHVEGPSYTIPGTNETVKACTTSIAKQQAGGMKMAPWHIPEGYTFNLKPCRDPNNQDYVIFPFTFTVNGIEEDIIPYVYVTGICDPSRPGPLGDYVIIEDLQHMKTLVTSGRIGDHCNLLQDICHAYGSDPNNPGYQLLYKYVLKEIVDAHEDMHADNYKEVFNNIRDLINENLEYYNMPCSTYQNMTENEVRQIVLKNYTEIFNSFIEDVESALNRRDRNELEEDILTSEDQVWRLYPYYKWLYWEYYNA
jgi:hypothetical protein